MAVIAFIGLGHMGGPMAAALVRAGHTVRGLDLSQSARDIAAAAGIDVVLSVPEAVSGAEAVFLSLPRGEHVRAVLDGPDGVWAHAQPAGPSAPGVLIMDTSTVDIATSQWCHDESAARGLSFCDTPVSGGTAGAAAGTLAVMIGGTEEATTAAQRWVEPFSARAIRAGGPTAGIAAKLTNNMMLFIETLAVTEGAVLADRLGLDPAVFNEIVSVSSGRCWAQETWYPMPGVVPTAAANTNFEATFSAALALKDATLAVGEAERVGVNVPAARVALEQYQRLVDEGYGDRDCTLTVKYVSADGTARGWDPVRPTPTTAGKTGAL